jgi:acyl-CoA thioester hydrolase
MASLPHFTAVVHPWHCDTMGHVNTRFYAGIFDDASLQVLEWVSNGEDPALGWADVTWNLTYQTELNAGTCVRIASTITALGTKSLTVEHCMESLNGGRRFAVAEFKIVRFDKRARKAIAIEQSIRSAALLLMA